VRQYKTLLSHDAGMGGQKSALVVQIDAPSALADSNGQWYRIRATGVAEVPGAKAVGFEPSLFFSSGARQSFADKLRKFSFMADRSSGQLTGRGQAARSIEVIAKPVLSSMFVRPFTLKNKVSMSGGWVDSFDSGDPTKSTLGLYDVTKRQSHGDVATTNSTSSNLGGVPVYGNLQYSGPTPSNTSGVKGTITTPFSYTFKPVNTPSWTVINPTPTTIGSSMTLTGGTASAPARYKVSSLSIPAGKVLTMAPSAAGQESYIEVWVTGSFTTSGSGYILQQSGVHVTYYVEGNITVSGGSFNNQNNVASSLQIYGVTPSDGSSRTLTVSGGGTFIGVVDAPEFDVVVSGSANLSGAFIANTASLSGGASMHYDEALARMSSGGNSKFTVVSWAEDLR
jgi:hypothetical protein